ncbi:MAG: transglutaminase domain-containing protein [Muribaculaceae bacterium]|nr:transglutaminase domain-containing protein [Muribaculaceae bacterium]
MKKIVLFAALFCSLATATAANSEQQHPFNAFLEKMQGLAQQVYDSQAKKDTAQIVEKNYKAINFIESNRETLTKYLSNRQFNSMKNTFYYDLACIDSRQGNIEAAIYNLSQAAICDYGDWKHIIEDHDLDNIRSDERFKVIFDDIRSRFDFPTILKQAAPYTRNERRDTLPTFSYQSASDPNLKRVREYFRLDSVAGNGDEISKIKNVLTYIHNLIRHDGQHGNPIHLNSIDMAEACKDGSRGLNCRGLAIVLAECYLSMGIPARYVTCFPKEYIDDCHVINVVWSSQLKKWLWVDPTFNAWVTDENGQMLSIQEVRERLRDDRLLVLNDDANWNNDTKQTVEHYLREYMTKNLYYVSASTNQEFGVEDPDVAGYPHFVDLMPTGFIGDSRHLLIVNDDEWFWQAP